MPVSLYFIFLFIALFLFDSYFLSLLNIGPLQPLLVYLHTFDKFDYKYSTIINWKSRNSPLSGFEPWTTGWQLQADPLDYGDLLIVSFFVDLFRNSFPLPFSLFLSKQPQTAAACFDIFYVTGVSYIRFSSDLHPTCLIHFNPPPCLAHSCHTNKSSVSLFLFLDINSFFLLFNINSTCSGVTRDQFHKTFSPLGFKSAVLGLFTLFLSFRYSRQKIKFASDWILTADLWCRNNKSTNWATTSCAII